MFYNWLVATIIQQYDVSSQKINFKDARSGKDLLALIHERIIISQKFKRSFVIFVGNIYKLLQFCKKTQKHDDKKSLIKDKENSSRKEIEMKDLKSHNESSSQDKTEKQNHSVKQEENIN